MISAEYCGLMARYNTWQNASLVTAADGLTNEDRWKDRGAFFQSIAATLNHLYWADALMLRRLKGNERPEETIKHSLTKPIGLGWLQDAPFATERGNRRVGSTIA